MVQLCVSMSAGMGKSVCRYAFMCECRCVCKCECMYVCVSVSVDMCVYV